LPHAIRILERDCGAEVETVRLSAVRGLAELEGIIHSRLPPQKGPSMSSQQTELGEEKVVTEEDNDDEEIDEMIVEETVVEEGIVNGDEKPEGPVSVIEPTTTISETHHTRSSLPSFVKAAQTTQLPRLDSSSTATPSVQKIPEPVHVTATKVVKSTKDVYSMGAWKGVQTNEDEEDEEMPEIDMGFDSDED
jgi:hypothetical protein